MYLSTCLPHTVPPEKDPGPLGEGVGAGRAPDEPGTTPPPVTPESEDAPPKGRAGQGHRSQAEGALAMQHTLCNVTCHVAHATDTPCHTAAVM